MDYPSGDSAGWGSPSSRPRESNPAAPGTNRALDLMRSASQRPESNRLPPDYETGAHPHEPHWRGGDNGTRTRSLWRDKPAF